MSLSPIEAERLHRELSGSVEDVLVSDGDYSRTHTVKGVVDLLERRQICELLRRRQTTAYAYFRPSAGPPVTVDDVMSMIRSSVSDEEIVAKIRANNEKAIGSQELLILRAFGASNTVIGALQQPR